MWCARWLLLASTLSLCDGEDIPVPVRYGVDRDGFRVVVDLALPPLPAERTKLLEQAVIQELPDDKPAQPIVSLDAWVTTSHAETVTALNDLKAKQPDAASLRDWFDETSVTTTWSGGGVISLRFERHGFSGGAHSTVDIKALLFDAATLQQLTLDDVIPRERQDEFSTLVSDLYGARHKLAPGTDLHVAGLQVDALPAVLPLITANGLTVVYEPYEVGPWVLGTVTVQLTREQARPFLRRDPWDK